VILILEEERGISGEERSGDDVMRADGDDGSSGK